MWTYEKKLQYPVRIKNPNPALAKVIITQLGGPDGELAASLRYLNQRYAMPYDKVKAMLTDVGTEELAHMEMIAAIVYQLTRNLNIDEIKAAGFDAYFVDHTAGIYPQAAAGFPFNAAVFQSKGDPITDLMEDWAAEQKARTTYDNLIRLVDDPDVLDPLRFLREREIVHFQRFGESLEEVRRFLDSRNFYAVNPAFDTAPVDVADNGNTILATPCCNDCQSAGDNSMDNYGAGCACADQGVVSRSNVDNSYGASCVVAANNSSCPTVQPPSSCQGTGSAPPNCGCSSNSSSSNGRRTNTGTNSGSNATIYGDGSCCKSGS